MNFDIPLNGKVSRNFLIGYFAVFNVFLFSINIKTLYYSNLLLVLKQSPLSSFVIASPFIFLLGMFIQIFTKLLVTKLFKVDLYKFDSVPEKLISDLQILISEKIAVEMGEAGQMIKFSFSKLKSTIFHEEESIFYYLKWKFEILLSFCFIAIISLAVLGAKAINFGLSGIDWFILTTNILTLLISIPPLSELRQQYTLSEVVNILKNSNKALQPDAAEPRR